jgi:uncharacterized membrane protein
MKSIFLQEDINLVEGQIRRFEDKTGCELLIVVADECDPYPAAAWRFGVLSTFLITLIFSYSFEFHSPWMWPLGIFSTLFFMTWVGKHSFAKRLSLSDWEINRECREKAIELFYTLGHSKVSHEMTAMIMISRLERNIQVLVDEELRKELTQQELDELVIVMREHFKSGHMALGLCSSIEKLESKILLDFGGKLNTKFSSELPNKIHFIS